MPGLVLAAGTEERRTLSLHNPFNDRLLTRRTQLSFSIIHPMMILISTVLIQGIAVGTIIQR